MNTTIRHLSLARLCQRAYIERGPEVRSRHETDVLIEQCGDVTVLSIRGTEFSSAWPRVWTWEGFSNTRDVIRDVRFIPWRCPASGTWVHKGFGISAHTWFNRYHRSLPHSAKYVITGHSLGAAIAPQLARIMQIAGRQVDEVVLFGEPGGHYWGSREHYADLNIPTTSYRTRNDWIRFAGYDRTVERTILPVDGLNMAASHNIESYVISLFHLGW